MSPLVAPSLFLLLFFSLLFLVKLNKVRESSHGTEVKKLGLRLKAFNLAEHLVPTSSSVPRSSSPVQCGS